MYNIILLIRKYLYDIFNVYSSFRKIYIYIYKEELTVFTSGSKMGGLLAREEECLNFNFMLF